MIDNYKKFINIFLWVHTFFALMLMSSWVFPFWVQRIALWGFFLTYIADIVIERRLINIHWRPMNCLYIAMILFYLLIPIWQVFTGSCDNMLYKKAIDIRLAFLGAGIIGILGISKHIKIRYFAYSMGFVSVCTLIYLISNIGFIEFLTNPNRNMLLTEMRIEKLNSHMVYNLFLNISLAFLSHTIIKSKDKPGIKIILGIEWLLIFGALFMTEGRVGFFTALMQVVIFTIYLVWIKFKVMLIPIFIVAVLGVGVALEKHERMVNVMHDTREVIWNICIDMIKEKPLLGYGVSTARETLVNRGLNDDAFRNRYYESGFLPYYDASDKYLMHPHNVFLEAEMEFGILGLLLVIFMFTYPVVMCRQNRRLMVFTFLFIILVQAMFETYGPSIQPTCFCFGLLFCLQGGKD